MSDNLARIKRTSQAIDNFSFDEEYFVSVVLPLELDPSGALTRKVNDPTDGYKISDIDDAGYFGFVRQDGAWYIMREVSGAWRYYAGASNYSTGWTNRASHSYDYFSTIF